MMKRAAYRLGWLTIGLWLAHSGLLLLDGWLRLQGSPQVLPGDLARLLLEAAAVSGLGSGAAYGLAVGVHRSVIWVWAAAGCIALVSIIVQFLPADNVLQASYHLVLARGMRLYMAYPMAAAAAGFWLARCFSRLPEAWFQAGLYVVGGVLALAGALLTLADLYPSGSPGWITGFTTAAVGAVPPCLLIYARHAYAPLANRSDSPALAAHWAALCLLLLLWGMGLAGSITAPVVIRQWVYGTRITDLQAALTLYAALAMGLGGINQMAMELRGIPRRVTGLMPFWLMSFSLHGLGLTWLLAGSGQLYLGRMAGVPPQAITELTRLLYSGQVIAACLMLLGAAIYAVQLWVRRPVKPTG